MSGNESSSSQTHYDGHAKEASLRAESEAWDTARLETAQQDDIPRIDIRAYLVENNDNDQVVASLVEQLRYACTQTGFFYLTGHGVATDRMFAAVRDFYNLSSQAKQGLLMDRPDFPVGGVGYLPMYNRKLPSRKKGNANEAYVVKRQSGKVQIKLQDNPWPDETTLPGFREEVTAYANAVEDLALKLLPLYARALDLEPNFFAPAFTQPMYRLRMTKYPPIQEYEAEEFGIAPHVDTSFLTILAQDSEGLIIYSEKRQQWLRAPLVEGALVINSGELLRQWTNDHFLSVKHFANNNLSDKPRYSVPFFFNANADYRMECIPTCCSSNDPPKYPPFSYEESQAVAQGE